MIWRNTPKLLLTSIPVCVFFNHMSEGLAAALVRGGGRNTHPEVGDR